MSTNNQNWTVIEALNWASSFLNKQDRAAELLLMHHLNCDRTHLLTQLQDPIPQHVRQQFRDDIHVYKNDVPVQHLIGSEVFYGRSYTVNEEVLIPRPETEELVWHVLAKLQERFLEKTSLQGCDIGTGSGAIAISLVLEDPRLEMSATDISKKALQVARGNAAHHQANVCFMPGHLLEPFIRKRRKMDLIVSNPPYIETATVNTLHSNVRNYEPHLALDGGQDGLDFYREIIAMCPNLLNEQALIAFEVGDGQAEQVFHLLKLQFPQALLTIKADINKKARLVLAEIGF